MMSKFKSLFVPEPIQLENGKVVQPPFKTSLVVTILLIIFVYLSAKVTKFDLQVLISQGNEVVLFIQRMFPPNWKYLEKVQNPMIQTIVMSFLGTVIAAVFALPAAYISSSNMNTNSTLRTVVRLIFSTFRTIPVLILALILTYIFGLNTFSGMMAIALFTFSIITKMTYEQIELADMGPFEASMSTGATKLESFRVAIFPQISGLYISTILYNLEMNIRSAAILGYVGAGGIGILMNESIGWREYQNLATILIVLLVTVVVIESISREVRKRLA